MSLTPDQAQKVLQADVVNILRKARAGRTLTSRERALMESAATGVADAGIKAQAKNKTELAQLLKVSRQTINNWFALPNHPKPQGNGRHDVSAWLEFIRQQGLKEAAEPGDSGATLTLRDRRLTLQCEKLEAEIAVLRDQWFPRVLLDDFLDVTFSAVRQKVLDSALPPEEQDAVLADLNAARQMDFTRKRGAIAGEDEDVITTETRRTRSK